MHNYVQSNRIVTLSVSKPLKYTYTFAAGSGTGATGCVTSAAFKEVDVVGLDVRLPIIPGPA